VKAELLLLPSQMEVMNMLFEELDKYNDCILKRRTFIYKLRVDPRIIDFIHFDAIKTERGRVLTLDEALLEIEHDENYETR
jgi:hypothetical protein